MPMSSGDLLRLLTAAGEEPNIDAKGPIEWDGGDHSASIAKDIAAFSNTRDGGVLVIGKTETDDGFDLCGLTEEQALSFDTTDVAKWINSRFSPPINCVCYQLDHDGKRFVIITIQEFTDIPTVCIKEYKIDGGKVLIRNGAIYVRTANTESAPLSSENELREIIGIATTKRGNQLLGMFQAAMKGRSLLDNKPEDDRYKTESENVLGWLKNSIDHEDDAGAWTFLIHPSKYEKRWKDVAELRQIVAESEVYISRRFPSIDPTQGLSVVEYGISSEWREDIFCLTWSGLFTSITRFWENYNIFDSPYGPKSDLGKGTWLEWRMTLTQIVEFFLFASRYIERFEIGEEFKYEIKAGPINGRRLVSAIPVSGPECQPCRATWFKEEGVVTAETLRTSWRDMAAKTAHRFVQYFFGELIPLKTIEKWILAIEKRQ